MFCVNTLNQQQDIYLPPASTLRGATLTIKDISGNAAVSSIHVYTTGLDTFENSTNTSVVYATINSNYGAVTFTSDSYSSWLVTQYYTGPPVAVFSPLDYAGLIIWNDANQIPFGNGTYLETWPNLGSGGTVNCSGVLYTEQLNGLPTVSIATYQNWAPTFLPNLNNYSMFFVTRQTGGTNSRMLTGSTYNQLYGYWGGYKLQYYLDSSPGYLGSYYSDTSWDIYTNTRYTGGLSIFNYNGSLLYSNASSSGNNLYDIYINTGSFGSYEASDCQMAEFILYNNVLGSNDVAKFEGYLAWKWGLNANLPPSHPYYSSPP